MLDEHDFFEEVSEYTGPPIEDADVRRAEADLGVKLPHGYVDLLLLRNGGVPQRRCLRTSFPTSWASDHIEVTAILGIGGQWGIDSSSAIGGSSHLVSEWGYPAIGVVFALLPSGGHDTLMLDYSSSGTDGEPSIAYVDEDRIPRTVADTFDSFIAQLESCEDWREE